MSDHLPKPPMTTEERRAFGRALPKCTCGNTVSRSNQERGAMLCSRCETTISWQEDMCRRIEEAGDLDAVKEILSNLVRERI